MNPTSIHRLPVPLPITEIEFCAWVSQAEPGEVIEYHRGFLCIDRCGADRFGTPIDAASLNQLASRALALAEAGFVHLIQQRIEAETFGYLAIARPLPEGVVRTSATLMSEEAA